MAPLDEDKTSDGDVFSKSAAILSDFNADDSFDTDTEVVVKRCVVDDGVVVNADVETDRDASSMVENFMIGYLCVCILLLIIDGCW